MKKCSKRLSIFLLVAIALFNSCFNNDGDTGATSGTVTVTLTGASAFNGNTFYYSIFSQSDLVTPRGFGSFTIATGGGSGIIQSSGSDLSLTNGTYYFTCFIDEDGNTDPTDPTVGTNDDYSVSYATVNADTTVDLTYPDDFTVE